MPDDVLLHNGAFALVAALGRNAIFTKKLFPYHNFPAWGIDVVAPSRINFVFLYIAYLQQIISNKKSGIPELNLDFAAFACLVEGTRNRSTFVIDVEAIIDAKAIIEKSNGG